MSKEEEIRKKLRELATVPVQVFPAKVIAINREDLTIDVEPIGRAEIPDVRIRAGIEGITQGVIEIPARDSMVLVGLIGNDPDEAYLVKATHVREVILTTQVEGQIRVTAPQDGSLLVKGSTGSSIDLEAGENGAMRLNGLPSVPVEINSVQEGEVIINGGNNGGMTITPTLRAELQKNNVILQALLNVINGAPIPEPGQGAPSALQSALSGAVTGRQVGDFSNIENDKVKH